MRKALERYFEIEQQQSSWKQEIIAGMVSYFAVVYIVVVNATILADAGMPLQAGMIATLITSIVGCFLMAVWGKSPIIVVPGMGINAFFTYTMVHSMGLQWQEALAVVTMAGILFMIVAFTKLYAILSEAIPHSLQEAITVGIGLFITFIGLQKSGIVIAHQTTFVAIGHFTNPHVLVSSLTLIVAIILFARNVQGGLLITLGVGTGLAFLFGLMDFSEPLQAGGSFEGYGELFGHLSLSNAGNIIFWIAVFLILMIIVFENIGLLYGQTRMINQNDKFKKSLQAMSVSTALAGIFGSSPVVAAAESAAGISAGGRTGITPITTCILFGGTFFFIPFLKYIPDSAIAPILILIGGLMVQSIKNIDFGDFSEAFPAFLTIAMIPFTYSIVDGMAFGFIAYPIVKLSMGKAKDIPVVMYGIATLFVLNFILQTFS